MSYHVVLREASCIICRQSIEPRDGGERHRVAAVIGDMPYERLLPTLPFDFPALDQGFVQLTVFNHGKVETWRSCRDPACITCRDSPEAFTFHMQCFSLIRKQSRDQHDQLHDTLLRIWLAGHWSRPWPRVYYEAGPLQFPSATPLAELTCSDPEFALLLARIQQLPSELLQMIIANSADSPIWTYAMALAWRTESFGDLKGQEEVTLSLSQLFGWRRGKDIQTCGLQADCNKIVRLALDHNGIKSVDLYDNVVEDSRDTWYVCENLTRLKDFHLRSKGGFLRLEPKRPRDICTMWDTPTPPLLNSCHFFRDRILRRVRTVSFDKQVTGITVFCSNGSTYGICAHRGRSSAFNTYLKIPRLLRRHVVWLYFPLAPEESIEAIWIRWSHQARNRDKIALVMQTSHDRLQTFGHYLRSSELTYEHHYFPCHPIDRLLYLDPDPGKPILCFGAGRASWTLSRLQAVTSYSLNFYDMYHSFASLENVKNVQCFYGSHSASSPGYCIGMLLEYSNKGQVALGQCRLGMPQSIHAAPTRMYIQYEDEHRGVLIHFGPEQPDSLDWEVIEMVGGITWWFNHNKVKIIHSGY